MHRFGAWLPVLLLLTLTGCFTSPTARPCTWLDRFRAANRTLPPDGVWLDIFIVEEKLDNPFLNRDLWKDIDQSAVGIKRKTLLARNGLRTGPIIGMAPGKLHDLLAMSERSCIKPEGQMLASGSQKIVPLGPCLNQCQFTLYHDDFTTPVLLASPQPQLVVTPTLTEDGRTTLHFLPQMEHSQMQPEYRPAPDRTDWLIEYHRPRETYSDLSWEVTLGANDFVVVGALLDDMDTLGAQCFAQEDEHVHIQRLLVIRTTRNPPDDDDAPATGGPPQPPPLALQAILSTNPVGGP